MHIKYLFKELIILKLAQKRSARKASFLNLSISMNRIYTQTHTYTAADTHEGIFLNLEHSTKIFLKFTYIFSSFKEFLENF